MNKNQFYENLRNQKIKEEEIQRKWRSITEEKEFYEKIMMFEAARSASSASASGAGGGGLGIAFYAFGASFDNSTNPGIFLQINGAGSIAQIGEQMFAGPTVLCRNTDNGNMYYISLDDSEGEMVIGTVNVTTGVQTELDRSILTALNYSSPGSLVYTGNNTFVYLANSYFYTVTSPETQEIIQIQIVDGEVTVTSLSEYDSTEIGLSGVFQWNGECWALQIAPFGMAGVYTIDINTGVVESFGAIELINYPFSEMYKFTAWSLSQAPGGKIYVSGSVQEKDNGYLRLIIAELDPENYTASYVETVNFFFGDPYVPVDIEIA